MDSMVERPTDLPDFEHPPVAEVAIAAEFGANPEIRQGHLGLFWAEVRDDFPRSEDRPRTEPSLLGDFGSDASFEIQLLTAPPINRAWFVSADDSLLVQIQDDRFVHNWRLREQAYPRFENLTDLFWKRFDTFVQVLESTGLARPEPRSIEVTYVNWIPTSDLSSFFLPAPASALHIANVEPQPTSQLWASEYRVSEQGNEGNLVIEVKPGGRLEAAHGWVRGYLFSLTFRASLQSTASRDDISNLLNLGRSSIVRGFTELTTKEMHEKWGRKV